ncbi:MAG: S8 family serine peptidase [Verrucomicrobiota bacterium]
MSLTPSPTLKADAQPDTALLETGLVAFKEGSGVVRRYRLALNEMYEMTSGREGVRSIHPQADARAMHAYSRAQVAQGLPWPALVLYPEAGPVSEASRRILTGRMLVELKSEQTATPDLRTTGLEVLERPSYAPRHLITRSQDGSPWQALASISRAASLAQVVSITPLLKRAARVTAAPNDPLFSQQWHLQNTGQGKGLKGMDAQVPQVWDQHQGDGIHVAIVDTGIERAHPDLQANVEALGHWNWFGQNDNPEPGAAEPDGYHGTAVAGIVAAAGNNLLGGIGVAPRARLIGFRLLGGPGGSDLDDAEIAMSVTFGNDHIQVKNNSWGWVTGPAELVPPEPLFTQAMETSSKLAREGKGIISVWSSGNGRTASLEQGNKGGLANDIHAIAVGALTNTGKLAIYSETGAHLTCVGPSGGGSLHMVSSDLSGLAGSNPNPTIPDIEDYNYTYTRNLQGTSFSAPVVSGVCALMLQANPNLSWRDVKEILLRSSLKIEPYSAAWVTRTGGIAGNELLPPIKHHHNYGGGLVQAKAAVDMALAWVPLGPEVKVSKTIIPGVPLSYDGKPPISTPQRAKMSTIVTPPKKPKRRTVVANVDMSTIQPMRVENVSVTLDITHSYRGDLGVILRSPSGVTSTLISPSPWDLGANYPNINLTSMRHWGEPAQGIWKLEITDYQIEGNGTFDLATLKITGTAAPAAQITSQSSFHLLAEGSPVTLAASSILSSEGGSRAWSKDGKVIAKQTATTLPNIGLKVTDAGVYSHSVGNKWGKVFSAPIPVAIVRRQVPAAFVNEGRTTTFSVVSSGAYLAYQWFRSGSVDPLVNNGRVTGVTTAVLTIRDVAARDEDDYYCRVSLFDPATIPQEDTDPPVTILAHINTIPAGLMIRRRPVVDAASLNTPITVSEALQRQITADNEVTRWTVTGLPPGVTFDSKTARIIGAPNKAGHYVITIIASNSVGGSVPVEIVWDVQGLPAYAIGTFNGYVPRSDLYNGGFGGMLTLTTTTTGTYSGTITRGVHSHTFTGRLSASSEPGSRPSGLVPLVRRAPYGPLHLRFELDPTNILLATLTDPSLLPPDVVAFAASLVGGSADYVGRWNMTTLPNSALIGNSAYPQGASWYTLTVSPTGLSTMVARLADGTAITRSYGLGHSGDFRFHAMLYGNAGSFQGAFNLDETIAGASSLTWFKVSGTVSRSYAAGFPVHTLFGGGGRYVAPTVGQMVFGIGIAPDNARLTFTGGGLTVPFVQTFTLAAGNIVSMPQGSANPHQIKVSMDLKTGIITGSGSAMDINPLNPAQNRQRPGTFSALLNPVYEQAHGHFLLPTSTSPTSPILSGHIVGEENMAP